MGIKEVARLSGVGVATVSRVINNSGFVSETTRAKVLRVVREVQYIPNGNARGLKSSQPAGIALIVKGITNPFFANMIRETERLVNLRNDPLLIHQVEDGVDELMAAAQLTREKNPRGLLFLGGTFDHTATEFSRLTAPFVLNTISTELCVDPAVFSSVTVDDQKEAQKATEYLLEMGHRRVGFMGKSPFTHFTTGNQRLRGYMQALQTHGIPFDARLVEDCEYQPASGFSAMKRLLNKPEGVTAVFASSDSIAIGAAKAALVSGLRIPEDISVIGFDGIDMAEYYHPSLDTICQPNVEMAQCAVEIIYELIADPTAHRHKVFEAVLLRRGSCRPPQR